ncbi:hypothetical protein D3C81_2283300 [compost metagenome]
MHRAIRMPSGIWMASTEPENSSWRSKALCRSPSSMTMRNHSVPTKTFCVGLRISCTE